MRRVVGDPCETSLIVCLRRDGGLEAALAVVFEPAGQAPDAVLLSGDEPFGTAQVHGGAEQVQMGAVRSRPR